MSDAVAKFIPAGIGDTGRVSANPSLGNSPQLSGVRIRSPSCRFVTSDPTRDHTSNLDSRLKQKTWLELVGAFNDERVRKIDTCGMGLDQELLQPGIRVEIFSSTSETGGL